jgi:hypothetical protein
MSGPGVFAGLNSEVKGIPLLIRVQELKYSYL